MNRRGRLVLISLIALFSTTGSSAKDTASPMDAVHAPLAAPSDIQSQKRELPWEIQVDVRERKTLAWIILLLKDGRAAR
jgi:hypothetical protein